MASVRADFASGGSGVSMYSPTVTTPRRTYKKISDLEPGNRMIP